MHLCPFSHSFASLAFRPLGLTSSSSSKRGTVTTSRSTGSVSPRAARLAAFSSFFLTALQRSLQVRTSTQHLMQRGTTLSRGVGDRACIMYRIQAELKCVSRAVKFQSWTHFSQAFLQVNGRWHVKQTLLGRFCFRIPRVMLKGDANNMSDLLI